ncbi:MAG: M2 family metallopeptidase [Planctomycetota bacterium]|jgi:peptidyl-dipeptidase A
MKTIALSAFLSATALFIVGCAHNAEEKRLQESITAHVAKVEPLSDRANLTYWNASTTGKSEHYDRFSELQIAIRGIYSDPQEYAFLKNVRQTGRVGDSRLARQLDKLYYSYLQNQIEPELLKKIVALDTRVQEKYNNFRGTMDGKKVTNSEIYTILTTEKDVRKRELAWKASKQVGDAIIDDFLELVKLRNRAAKKLGFDSYHTLSIVTGEQSVQELDRIFDELHELTNEPFALLKEELDRILADSYGIAPEDLMPWHYHDPFFQRTPLVYDLDLDIYYKDRDVKELSEIYYAGVGLPVNDILARSDLYDRENKYPHAFSEDLDRKGDVRILCNLQNTERWMETILHELGHAVYSKYHDPQEPWLLREPAHSFTTEAIAMFFGRLSRNAAWMQEMLDLPDDERAEVEKVSEKYLRFQQVLFARWAMVMYNFEKQLYADPDQDLNDLWWDMVEKYQLIGRPPGPADAGWASKLHFTTAPCYYHNYMLGELLASQLHHYIVYNLFKLDSADNVSYVGDKALGEYLRREVLGPGARYHWNDMIERATGEPLTPRYFVEQFVK